MLLRYRQNITMKYATLISILMKFMCCMRKTGELLPTLDSAAPDTMPASNVAE